VHGQSITDACLSLDRTVPLLEQLAQARASARRAAGGRRQRAAQQPRRARR